MNNQPHEFASAEYTARQLNAIIDLMKKRAGVSGPERFLDGTYVLSEPRYLPLWYEKDGVVYFTVISHGTTGEEWVATSNIRHGDRLVDSVIRSSGFTPTSGAITVVGVMKGGLIKNESRFFEHIRAEADKRKFTKPSMEIACLIREKFSNTEILAMGIKGIVVMHEPIFIEEYGNGCPLLLEVCTSNPRQLSMKLAWPDYAAQVEYLRKDGFAFVVGQIHTPN